MNLEDSPNKEQLKAMIAACDDSAGHHIVWVDKSANVHVEMVPHNLSPIGFEQSKPQMVMRLGTFSRGASYVGHDAANDEGHVSDVFSVLINKWPTAKLKDEVTYIDDY